MNKIILKMSYWKIFSRLFDILSAAIGFVVISLVISHFKTYYFFEIFLLLCVIILPSIILFFEYLFVTYKQLTINFTDTDVEIFYRNGTSKRLNFSEIEAIKLYKAAGNDKGNFTININENYFFAKIFAKDETTLILTSLLGPDLSVALDTLNGIPINRTKTGYAFIFIR